MNIKESDEERSSALDHEKDRESISFTSKKVQSQEIEACGRGKEVAIQTNAHEIERSSALLPLRKRFVPLKFSDYCVFANNVKEEDEEEEDVNFTPTETATRHLSNKADKPKRSRGRPRKSYRDKEPSDDGTENGDNGEDTLKKQSIIKVSNGFKCGLCGRVFSLRGNAKAHLITHTNVKPFTCDFKDCGKSLRTKESLRRHKLSHLGIKTFECSECKKKFSCNLSLQEHMTLHTGEKPLSCDICGLKFRQIAVLKRHFTTHSNNKPFACDVCGKRFSLKVYVRSHMKTHTGERPYVCNICTKSFAHASDLNRHKIIHSGKKPYECSVCSMRYSDPSSRRRHEREHQSKQQYVCHLCSQQFPRAGQLRVHLVKQHAPATVDTQSLPFKVEIDETSGQEKASSWDPCDESESSSLLNLPPTVVHAVPNPEVSSRGLRVGETEAIMESVQIVLDSSCAGQIGTAKEVMSIPLQVGDGMVEHTDGNGVQTMVMEIPRDAEQLTGLPTHGTYKVINTGDGNQIFELQVEKDSQSPYQDFSGGEMKINLSDIKISEGGLVAFIQDGNTVTVLEQPQPPGLSMQKKDGHHSHSRDSTVEKYISNVDNKKVLEVVDSNSIQDGNVVFSESSLEHHEHLPSIEEQMQSSLSQNVSEDNDMTSAPTPIDKNDSLVTETQNLQFEIPTHSTFAISSPFVDNPDLTSQDYYNWLSSFSEECKTFTMPLSKDVFQKISQVQKTLSDFMAIPTGVITDKTNFKILMSITQDLSKITTSHLDFMFSNLNK